MSEEYKAQVSIKFGPLIGRDPSAMLNLRAGTLAELDQMMNDALDLVVPSAGLLAETLVAVGAVAQAFPDAEVVRQDRAQQSTSSPASTGQRQAPLCTHGARVWRQDKAEPPKWAGWFCPQGSNAPDRCRPQYVTQEAK